MDGFFNTLLEARFGVMTSGSTHPSPATQGMLTCFLAAICLVAAPIAYSQTRVGYVDWEELIKSAPQIQVARDKLDTEFRAKNEAIAEKERDLLDREERLLRDSAVMSSEIRERQEREIRTLRRDVQREKEDLREELDYRLQEERQRVEEEIYDIVRAFAEENGFDLIIPGPALYASDAINLTGQLLQRLRVSFGPEQTDPEPQ
ncbi:MAG: OmpH family outer membrane protein [Xanthomonadales bacterium]|nr:OmpH family outer membrane protein [Xanthomonadales bacterium]